MSDAERTDIEVYQPSPSNVALAQRYLAWMDMLNTCLRGRQPPREINPRAQVEEDDGRERKI